MKANREFLSAPQTVKQHVDKVLDIYDFHPGQNPSRIVEVFATSAELSAFCTTHGKQLFYRGRELVVQRKPKKFSKKKFKELQEVIQ